MAKFSTTKPRAPQAPMRTTGPTHTHEGGAGYEKDAKTALYTLAVTNMVSEATFYEAGKSRDDRFVQLVRQVTAEDPIWMQGFLPWLRQSANMRSAPLVGALEYANASGPSARGVVASVLQRPDEPAEALGYWLHFHGRRMPMAVKRGIGDAAGRLYNERAVIKYDGGSRAVRMGDVIEYCHPKPLSPDQSELFKHILDRRHNHDGEITRLPLLQAAYELDSAPQDHRRRLLRERGPQALAEGGYTWERLSGWLPGGMDAEAWEAIIPSMGYMALIRNLRNFEKAKVNEEVLQGVAARIADPEQVARSKQFPYRFFSAYRSSGTAFFVHALEKALQASLANVPLFPGRTLVMVDTSGSMSSPVSSHSDIRMHEIAAVFASAVAAHSKVDLGIYADRDDRIKGPSTSVLRTVDLIANRIGSVGYGTYTWPSVMNQYDSHDRIIVFTDCQDHPARQPHLPDVPIYVWDLMGYRSTNIFLDNTPNRYLFSGFNDGAFRLISMLEAGSDAGWPWED